MPTAAAVELITRLPGGLLRHTAARYPHVIERIARDWASPHRLRRTLDDLMYDARGGRSGFPLDVLGELAELRRRYDRWMTPPSHGGH